MQPVLNVEDVKRVEVALTRVGVSVSELISADAKQLQFLH